MANKGKYYKNFIENKESYVDIKNKEWKEI